MRESNRMQLSTTLDYSQDRPTETETDHGVPNNLLFVIDAYARRCVLYSASAYAPISFQ